MSKKRRKGYSVKQYRQMLIFSELEGRAEIRGRTNDSLGSSENDRTQRNHSSHEHDDTGRMDS